MSASGEILVITGLSGSGKSHVLRALEDVGWFCVDNLPLLLIPRFAELIGASAELPRAALVVDVREPRFSARFPRVYRRLKARGLPVSLLFLEADERALVRRFSETRRPHPLAVNQPAIDGIREERDALRGIRRLADTIVDTSSLTVHDLREHFREQFDRRTERTGMAIAITSFGFKHGLPGEADLVFDVRFLPNPNFVPRLQRLTGQHPAVARFLSRKPETAAFLRRLLSFLRFVLPRYEREGKSSLTIAVGCTGGRHRSVMIATALRAALRERGHRVRLRHRDLLHA